MGGWDRGRGLEEDEFSARQSRRLFRVRVQFSLEEALRIVITRS